ncbi:MAG: L,D-transpeptidase family protein [Chloroflexota bacterium]
MNSNLEAAHLSITYAQQALQCGDRHAARRWAEKAAAWAPELEDPWLILASLAAPSASVTYIQRALRVNPKSERAREGMRWAQERLQRSQAGQTPADLTQPHRKSVDVGRGEETSRNNLRQAPQEDSGQAPTADLEEEQPSSSLPDTQPVSIKAKTTVASPNAETQPRVQETLLKALAQTAPPSTPLPSTSLVKYRWSFLTLFLIAICVMTAWVLWPGNASPARAFLLAPQSTPTILGAPADVDKPTYTPSPTSTFTPTATFTPTPTFTLTPTPTETFTPTETPWPTNTSKPWPTNTPYVYSDTGGERWIDVNLSQQRLYAYEGDTVVASFLVSTGVWQFPTVTGQFHIYIKLESTLMAGDGYYLPNVPYTMYFYKGYGIHGTYWHNNFGVPMSHGCVNMYTPDSKWMFYWASVGTLVNVHY